MAETKKELFISYGREPETVNFVRLLKRDLEKNGYVPLQDSDCTRCTTITSQPQSPCNVLVGKTTNVIGAG